MAGGMMNGGKKNGRYRPMAEINVTPMVDVMLVLLIIFMVTAPLLTTAVNVDLPKTAAAPTPQDDKPLTVAVNSQGQIFLQDTEVQLADLTAKLQAIVQNNTDKKIFVRGDKGNSYGRMLEVMGTIYQGGFTKVALLTDPSGGANTQSPGSVSTGVPPTNPGVRAPAGTGPAGAGLPRPAPSAGTRP
jgi:biopolymer transport protein TolR